MQLSLVSYLDDWVDVPFIPTACKCVTANIADGLRMEMKQAKREALSAAFSALSVLRLSTTVYLWKIPSIAFQSFWLEGSG